MDRITAALYARVSSDSQARGNTVASQLAALQERAAVDEAAIGPDHAYVDEGRSGATLMRPALERLRDAVVAGEVDRVYVHAPDRLARRYAYQVLLVEEFRRAGVEVVFLNRPIGGTAEDDLLLQVQGVIAEYERARILERSRRGRRYSALSGAVSALCSAPYGYRYLGRHAGGGSARVEVVEDEARMVRQVFTWIGSSGSACARLAADCRPWAAQPARGWTGGMPLPCVGCCATRPTRAPPCSAAPARSRPHRPGCARSAGAPTRRATPPVHRHQCRQRSGSRSRCLRSSTLACSRRCRHSSMRTAGASGGGDAGPDGFCRASWCAGSAVMRSTARWRAAWSGTAGRLTTATTGARGRMRTSSVAKRRAATAPCEAISWSRRCGGRYKRCWTTHAGSRPSTSGTRRRPGTAGRARMWTGWTGRSRACAAAWTG